MRSVSILVAVLVGLVSFSPCRADPASLLAPDNPAYSSGWRPPTSPTAGLEAFRPAETKSWLQLNKNVTPTGSMGGMPGMKGMGGGMKGMKGMDSHNSMDGMPGMGKGQ